jgi:hypothetical protein
MFQDSHLPLDTWFTAMRMIKAAPNTTSRTLQRQLNVAYQSARYLRKRITYALRDIPSFCEQILTAETVAPFSSDSEPHASDPVTE